MDIQILKKERMSESGNSLLKLMQTQSMSTLDLLVRESIQNSLDASKDRKNKTTVQVEFIINQFNTEQLCSHFPYISNQLKKRFKQTSYDYIAIRDSGTTGLTGDNDPKNDRTRLQGLIYQISKQQRQEGSGGNWGLGKTTFFRFGIGLVIYYSRTFENGSYNEKLAASLVEDELENNRLIKNDNNRGIAFFGQYSDLPGRGNYKPTVPISDKEEIDKFLSIFPDVKQYENKDTGTTVIIPFVDLEKHLSELRPGTEDTGIRDPPFLDSIEACLKILIQRWYAPRICNPNYEGASLKPYVNGQLISQSKMIPLFSLIQGLYNKSNDQNYTSDIIEKVGEDNIKTAPIRCNGIEGGVGGFIGSAMVPIKLLKLSTEQNRSAYAYIGDYKGVPGEPIVMFTRKPGMIVRYELRNSPWIPKSFSQDEDAVLICIFKLKSDAILKNENNEASEYLEEYVRACEKSDHYGWEDKTNFTIINRIANNTGNRLQVLYSSKVIANIESRSRLCAIFSDIFLPPSVLSVTTSNKSTNKRKSGNRRTKKVSAELLSSTLSGSERNITIEARSAKTGNTIEFEFTVNLENGSLGANDWESLFSTKFPLLLHSVMISGFSNRGKMIPCNDQIDLSRGCSSNELYSVEFQKTEQYRVPYKMIIRTEKPNCGVRCDFCIGSDTEALTFEIKTASGGE